MRSVGKADFDLKVLSWLRIIEIKVDIIHHFVEIVKIYSSLRLSKTCTVRYAPNRNLTFPYRWHQG